MATPRNIQPKTNKRKKKHTPTPIVKSHNGQTYYWTPENIYGDPKLALIRKIRAKQERKVDPKTSTKEYGIWAGIKTRCNNPSDNRFPRYGGRGIKLCERWQTFENFLADMGKRPSNHSIERIDNDGDYSPENCRWATASEQQRNQRRTTFVTSGGITRSAKDWAEFTGIPVHTIIYRIKSGWSHEETLSTPTQDRRAA